MKTASKHWSIDVQNAISKLMHQPSSTKSGTSSAGIKIHVQYGCDIKINPTLFTRRGSNHSMNYNLISPGQPIKTSFWRPIPYVGQGLDLTAE